MAERPMLMSAPMVRAILDGTKTQTRRVVKPQFAADALPIEMPATDPAGGWVVPGHSGAWWCEAAANPDDVRRCPYGQPGDRLWVREAWAPHPQDASTVFYRATVEADPGFPVWSGPWRPSIHMPRRASRITLEITSVRVERLQDISEADSVAEGIEIDAMPGDSTRLWRNYLSGGTTVSPAYSYQTLWEQINGPDSWAANPWVWVVEFRRIAP